MPSAVGGESHVRTSPYYPQSNGKLERVNRSLKEEAIRPVSLGDQEEAQRVIGSGAGYLARRVCRSSAKAPRASTAVKMPTTFSFCITTALP